MSTPCPCVSPPAPTVSTSSCFCSSTWASLSCLSHWLCPGGQGCTDFSVPHAQRHSQCWALLGLSASRLARGTPGAAHVLW